MNSEKPKAVLCYSGGLDSTVLLYQLRKEGYDVFCLSVDYAQRHSREITRALAISEELKCQHHVFTFPYASSVRLLRGSSQTDQIPVPDGHYTDESMKITVVPNRNMVLLSLATAWAVSLKADKVAYAAHKGDHTIYPDCRPEFIIAMQLAISRCDYNPPTLYTPFMGMTKAGIVKMGDDLNVPFEKTYSCYKGGSRHCGRCGTDVERKEAFKLAQVPDPTEYEDDTGAYRG
jgi:7-cyano-7-deazaguanine synthase